jgi:hypothetical protein
VREAQRARSSVADRAPLDHEPLPALLGTYLIFIAVFWYLLVAAPFGPALAGATPAVPIALAPAGLAPPLVAVDLSGSFLTPTLTRPAVSSGAITDWQHSAAGATPPAVPK